MNLCIPKLQNNSNRIIMTVKLGKQNENEHFDNWMNFFEENSTKMSLI